MRFIFLLFLIASCKSYPDKTIGTPTFLKIKLGDKLSFNEIKLRQFNSLYGDYEPLKYEFYKSNDTFVFKLQIDSFSTINVSDKNDVGVTTFYLEPGDNITGEIFWLDNDIKKRIFTSEYSGNNLFYQCIHDSIKAVRIKIKNTQSSFKSREELSNYVESVFESTIRPAKAYFSYLKMSEKYVNLILNPQLDIEKSYLKNQLIKSAKKLDAWPGFYSDTAFLNPQFKLWRNEDFFDFSYYLFGRVNKEKIGTFNEFIINAQIFYEWQKDSGKERIITSNAIIAFSNYIKFSKENPANISKSFDSICALYNLDKKKYYFPSLIEKAPPILPVSVLKNILLMNLPSENKIKANEVINDTSQIYYLDYWASWCQPCIKGLPFTIALQKRNIPKLTVLYINVDKEKDDFKKASTKYNLPLQQTYNVIFNDKNFEYYQKLNANPAIPFYQFIYFYENAWHVRSANSAKEPDLLEEIRELKSAIGK